MARRTGSGGNGPPSGDELDMAVGPGSTDRSSGDATTPGAGSLGRRRVVAVVVVVVLVAIGSWWAWSRIGGGSSMPAEAAPPGAPGPDVELRWSVAVPDGIDGRAVVVGDDDGADVVLAASGELSRLDGTSGGERWRVRLPPGEIVVGVADGRVQGPVVAPVDPPSGIRGIDLADGTTAWTRPADAATTVVRLDVEDLAVVDGVRCSLVDPATGRATLTVGAATAPCEASTAGLRWREGGQWLLADGRGRTLGRVPVRPGERDDVARRPQRIGPVVVRLAAPDDRGDRVVRATSPAGEPAWEVALDGDAWWRVAALGTDHVQVSGADGAVLLDAATGSVTARVPAEVVPVPLADGLRLLAREDGPGVLEATGVWSRSPDAAPLRLVSPDGRRGASRDVVVTSTPVGTGDGVVLAHGPDDDRRVSLLAGPDLDPVWSIPTSLRFGQVVATSDELALVVGDVGGGRRLDVLGN